MLNELIYEGKFVPGQGESFNVLNPANLDVITSIKAASYEQIDNAISNARQAFEIWKETPDHEVSAILKRIAQDIAEQKEQIAELITREQGKPLFLAQVEVDMAVYWINSTNELKIPISEHVDVTGKTIKVMHQPLGIVASITPWNWPFMIAVWHIIPALKAKNCVVNKPSEYTPLSTIRLVEIINRHLPAGVCNIVLGNGQVGSILSTHNEVDKIIFTGSSSVGQKILGSSISDLKKVVLELGGNDAAIVLDDVNIEDVAQKVFDSAFLNAGQTCACIKRLYVHENIYTQFIENLVNIADKQIIGDGLNIKTTMGPLQNLHQYQKVKLLLERALKQGAKISNQNLQAIPDKGYFLQPIILENVSEESEIFVTEQFGPILPIVKFKDIEDVIHRSNQSTYGLAGSVWSNDIDKALKVAQKMQTGTVWVNSHSDVSPIAEFGGWKMSGLGSTFGLSGLLDFTKKQLIHIS